MFWQSYLMLLQCRSSQCSLPKTCPAGNLAHPEPYVPSPALSGHIDPALPLSNKGCSPSTVLARSTIFMRFSVSVRVTKRASAEGGNTLYRAVCRCSAAASSCRAASSPALAAMYCCTYMRGGGAKCQLQTGSCNQGCNIPHHPQTQEGPPDPAVSSELAARSQELCVQKALSHSLVPCCKRAAVHGWQQRILLVLTPARTWQYRLPLTCCRS